MTLRSDDVDVENDICHTLISSRDHCLSACDFRLTTSKCLIPIAMESYKDTLIACDNWYHPNSVNRKLCTNYS